MEIFDKENKIGAVSHAGWRGTAAKIGVKTIEKHLDPQNRVVYVKEYDNEGNTYEQWRSYHWNGELRHANDSKGFFQWFDERGLPCK